MKLFLTLTLFVALSTFSFAQDKYAKISGKITESNGKPLALATVSLLTTKDSALVKTAITNNTGVFNMLNVKPGSYFISAFCKNLPACPLIKMTTFLCREKME